MSGAAADARPLSFCYGRVLTKNVIRLADSEGYAVARLHFRAGTANTASPALTLPAASRTRSTITAGAGDLPRRGVAEARQGVTEIDAAPAVQETGFLGLRGADHAATQQDGDDIGRGTRHDVYPPETTGQVGHPRVKGKKAAPARPDGNSLASIVTRRATRRQRKNGSARFGRQKGGVTEQA